MTSGDGLSHMELALLEGRAAAARGEVPVGAVLIGPSGAVLAKSGNRTRELNDPTAHAEIVVIREALSHVYDANPKGIASFCFFFLLLISLLYQIGGRI